MKNKIFFLVGALLLLTLFSLASVSAMHFSIHLGRSPYHSHYYSSYSTPVYSRTAYRPASYSYTERYRYSTKSGYYSSRYSYREKYRYSTSYRTPVYTRSYASPSPAYYGGQFSNPTYNMRYSYYGGYW